MTISQWPVRAYGTSLLVLLLGLLLVPDAGAQVTVYWDRDGATAGSGNTNAPSGTWINDNSAANRNWSTSSTGNVATARWNDGQNAVFSAGTDATGTYTITVSGTVSAASINIQEGTVGFTGGTINLNDAGDSIANFTIASGRTTTVNSVVSGFHTVNKLGGGTLVLAGSNTYTGITTINAGVLAAASNDALGTATWGNTIGSTGTLQLQGNIALTEGSFSIAASAGGFSSIRNLSGSNTLNAALSLTGSTTFTSTAGDLTATGQILLGNGNILSIAGSGNTTLSGDIHNSSGISKTGTGTLTLAGTGANSFGGALNVNDGTVLLNKTAGTNAVSGNAINVGNSSGAAGSAVLRLGASNQIADYAGQLTINSDGLLDLNNQVESINRLAGNGRIDLGTSASLTIGVNSGDSTFGGTILGSGTLIKAGSGSLTLEATLAIAGELQLNSGTLFLDGYNLSAGTLRITGNSTIDFAGGNSTLSATHFIVDAGVVLTVTNWANAADFFLAQNWSGAVFDTSGAAPMNQVSFTGFAASNTQWISYDNQVTPVPEPSTYGAVLMSLLLGLRFWRRRQAAAVKT